MKKTSILLLIVSISIFLSGCSFVKKTINDSKERKNAKEEIMAAGGIKIDKNNFPDSLLRSAVKKAFDTNKDGILSEEELKTAEELKIVNNVVEDMTGLELLPHLKKLGIGGSLGTELYVENFLSLEKLVLTECHFETIVIKANPMLNELGVSSQNNDLKTLDIQDNLNLEKISTGGHGLETVNIIDNVSLKEIFFFGHENFIDFMFVGSPELRNLRLQACPLASRQINFAEFPRLEVLEISHNNFTELDISHNTELTILDCSDNQIKELDLSNNTKLTEINCRSNLLEILDVSQLTELTKLACSSNELQKLDVSANRQLRWLDCRGNRIISIDTSNNPVLYFLQCGSNNMTSLKISIEGRFSPEDLTDDGHYTELGCEENAIPFLDFQGAAVYSARWWEMRIEMPLISGNTIDLSQIIEEQYLHRVSFTPEELAKVNGSFDIETGILTLENVPEKDENGEMTITYLFDTLNEEEDTREDTRYMPVMLVLTEYE